MSYDPNAFFAEDRIRAIDAKFEAQKIAFAPYIFQATLALRDLGLLSILDEAGKNGISIEEIKDKSNVSSYGIGVLLEIGMSTGILKRVERPEDVRYRLGKIGHILLHDRMTGVNMDFMANVCYDKPYGLLDSIINGKPEGLKSHGDWDRIYPRLSELPDKAKESWFAFNHYYSNSALSDVLPIVFSRPVSRLMDIGGNNADWSIACAQYNPDVLVTVVDLPSQVEMAKANIAAVGYGGRIVTHSQNVLDNDAVLPEGHDAVWMSQFLDCFSVDEVGRILSMIRRSIDEECDVWVLEPFWDKQKYEAAVFSLHATSLYFTSIANGRSKMYAFNELVDTIETSGFRIHEQFHEIGQNDYSLLKFRKCAL